MTAERKTAETVEDVAAAFRDYAYTVSHDLGAPVRAMVEFSRLLTDEHAAALNDEGREYLAVIVSNGQRLQKMMDGLLEYSRVNTRAKPFAPVDLNAMLPYCRRVILERNPGRHVTIKAGLMPVVHADGDQMMQLFSILLGNAALYQPAGSDACIQINALKNQGMWEFSVTDNGIGMDPRFCERVFRPLQRLHNWEEYEGVGMGLTIAQKIVNRHGGEISLRTAPRSGTTVLFTLPGG